MKDIRTDSEFGNGENTSIQLGDDKALHVVCMHLAENQGWRTPRLLKRQKGRKSLVALRYENEDAPMVSRISAGMVFDIFVVPNTVTSGRLLCRWISEKLCAKHKTVFVASNTKDELSSKNLYLTMTDLGNSEEAVQLAAGIIGNTTQCRYVYRFVHGSVALYDINAIDIIALAKRHRFSAPASLLNDIASAGNTKAELDAAGSKESEQSKEEAAVATE